MSAKLKKLSDLSKRGPHRVLEGDLGYTGLPGKVYTPAEGKNLPGIAFGHDWMKKVDDYHGTLRHLASWGIAFFEYMLMVPANRMGAAVSVMVLSVMMGSLRSRWRAARLPPASG